jgi:xanthosine utilization system XapX-like protein
VPAECPNQLTQVGLLGVRTVPPTLVRKKRKKEKRDKMLTFVALLLCSCGALTFISPSPPPISLFGKIRATLSKQLLPFADPAIYGTNVSVTIAGDYFGCFPLIQPIKGRVVWFANGGCDSFGIGQPLIQQWNAWQAAGAIGIIQSNLAGQGDYLSTKIY